MKKLIALFVVMLVTYQLSRAQSTPAIGSSYTTNVVTDLYPYQVGRKPNPDTTVHFKLDVNTKFQIQDIVTISGGAIKGYVITPWNFPDSVKNDTPKNSKGDKPYYKRIAKVDFYKTQYVNTTDLNTLKNTQDSLKKLRDSIITLNKQRKTDSLNVVQSKKAVADTTNIVAAKHQMVISLLNDVNPETDIVTEKSNTNKKLFSDKQLSLKQKYGNVENAPSALKKQLINAAAKLHFKNAGINNNITNYNTAAANLDTTRQKAKTDSIQFEHHKTQGPIVRNMIKDLSINNLGQTQPGLKYDKNAYKITKDQINDKLDTPANLNTEAAKMDNLAFLDSWSNRWTFFLPATAFSQNKVIPIYTRSDTFTWGFLSLPLKMRFGNSRGPFDFEQNLQFGITAGDKHQFAKTADVSINYLGGVSVVNVPLKDSTSTTAVSFSAGSMFQYGKFQVGVFVGVDLAGSKSAQFNYQGKPWIGIAIGVSLFGEGQTTATASVPNQ